MAQNVAHELVTSGFDFEGYRIVRYLGLVRGITVRSRSVVGTLGGALQTLVGGNISLFTELAEQSREEAYRLMMEHARQKGANAAIGRPYDATAFIGGAAEGLAYRTPRAVDPHS